MIRVIGLSDIIYHDILNHNHEVVRNNDDKMNMIEFIPECQLSLTHAQIIIECSDNYINFLCCDYWRIEIE